METTLPFEKNKREILVRKDSETSDKFGVYPGKRTVEQLLRYGIVNIDKPSGPTSHQVSDYVQKILMIKKSGHSGTLDPKVTGVLPIALGSATKVVHGLLTAGKEYIALMHLHQEIPMEQLQKAFSAFTGKIMQLPPVKSAVKRVLREREVYYLELLEMEGKDVLFRVGCEAGTYIRKLIFDMGKELGCGAHMAELRRTKAGPFDESTLFTLQDLRDAYHYATKEGNETLFRKVVLPMESAVAHLPKVWIFDATVESLCHGTDLKVPGISRVDDQIEEGNRVAILTLKGELVCMGTARMPTKNMLKDRGAAVTVDRVLMEPGTYGQKEKAENAP